MMIDSSLRSRSRRISDYMHINVTSFNRFVVVAAFFLFPLGQLAVQVYGIPISPHSVCFLYLALWCVFYLLQQLSLPRPNSAVTVYLVGLVFCFITIPFVGNKDSVLVSLLRQGELLLPYFVLLVLGRSMHVAEPALKGFIAGNAVGCLYALNLFFGGEIYYSGRLTYSEGYNPSAFGANIAAAIILLPLVIPVKRTLYITLLFLGVSFLFVVSLVLSQSRNALLALTLAGVGYFLLISLKKLRSRAGKIRGGKAMLRGVAGATVLLAVLGASLFLLFKNVDVDQRYFARLMALLEWSDSGAATAGRDTIWRSYIELPVPFFGFGFDNTESFISLVGLQDFPHNSFILLYMQGGVVFLSLYLVFIFLMLKEVRPRSGVAVPLSVAGGYLFLLNFGNDVYQYPYFWIPFAIVMAIVRQRRWREGKNKNGYQRAPLWGQNVNGRL